MGSSLTPAAFLGSSASIVAFASSSLGSDAAAGLDTWHRPDVAAALARVVVVDRGGREGGRPPAGWSYELVDVPALEVSSSDLRRRVADGAPIWGLVSPGVADVIEAHDLYQELS